jgi:hypothetical protein
MHAGHRDLRRFQRAAQRLHVLLLAAFAVLLDRHHVHLDVEARDAL